MIEYNYQVVRRSRYLVYWYNKFWHGSAVQQQWIKKWQTKRACSYSSVLVPVQTCTCARTRTTLELGMELRAGPAENSFLVGHAHSQSIVSNFQLKT